MAVKGVDISEWQGDISFQALKDAGAKFVIIRTGFGSDYPGQQDKQFEANVRKAEAAGMPWGVYHYAYAKSRLSGIDEANHCLRLLKGRKPLYGVWYDMEDNSTLGGDLAGAADGFCATIQKSGCYAGVYASTSWWNSYLTSSVFDKYDRWVAQYYTECQYKNPYGIWQYTSSWNIGGKSIDGNIAYKDYPSIIGGVHKEDTELEEEDMTEAEARKIAQDEIQKYFDSLGKKNVSEWAKDHVSTVKERGIMNGDADGNFRPRSPITREEVAATIVNALNIGKEATYGKEAFEKATKAGILDGTMPREALTREQFAVILDKLGLIGE